jgi:hypothetical protein
VHSKLNYFYLLVLTPALSILDLISAILEDPSCQKPSQMDIHAMKAAVGAIFTFSRLESHIHLFFSVPQRKNRLEEIRLDATGTLRLPVHRIFLLIVVINHHQCHILLLLLIPQKSLKGLDLLSSSRK